MQILSWILAACTILLLVVIVYYFANIGVDTKTYFDYIRTLTTQLQNKYLAQLTNGNTLVNLPGVELVTPNADLNLISSCNGVAVFLGNNPEVNYAPICKSRCGSNGRVIEVGETDEYYLNDVRLQAGFWCAVINPICNMNTSKVYFTPNGYTCRSKYPNLFGGPTGALVVACNDEFTNGNGSVFFDYLFNEPVDPQTVIMSNENELLPDGRRRFRCKFGTDVQGNALIEHPLNPVHPIRDYCTIGTPYAHLSAGLEYTDSGWWRCECGDPNITRLENEFQNVPKSRCTACPTKSSDSQLQVGYRCFGATSELQTMLSQPPCSPESFTSTGNDCERIVFKIAQTEDPLPLHPVNINQSEVQTQTIRWD